MKVCCVQCAQTKEMSLDWSLVGEFFCCGECVKAARHELSAPVPLPVDNVIHVDFVNKKRKVA